MSLMQQMLQDLQDRGASPKPSKTIEPRPGPDDSRLNSLGCNSSGLSNSSFNNSGFNNSSFNNFGSLASKAFKGPFIGGCVALVLVGSALVLDHGGLMHMVEPRHQDTGHRDTGHQDTGHSGLFKESIMAEKNALEAEGESIVEGGGIVEGASVVSVDALANDVPRNESAPLKVVDSLPKARDESALRFAQALERLLSQAAFALDHDRLTVPEGNNAYSLYQEVLRLEPGNLKALAGMQAIATRYEALAKNALMSENFLRAERLIERGLSFFPGDAGLLALRPVLKVHQEEKDTVATIERQVSPETQQRLDTHAALVYAREQVDNGNWVKALGRLEALLLKYPSAFEALEYVVDLYVKADDSASALTLIEHARDVIPEVKLRQLDARVLLHLGQSNKAIALLEANLPPLQQHHDYYSLLAGMYQTLGIYEKSALIYERLAADAPSNGRYWLGLAIAYDALSEFTEARRAFLRARPFHQGQADIRAYIDQRLAALGNHYHFSQ
ncbi:tetratricopeptide repeat protein [Marinibactrum halimedae]|uniref:Tetratricopeptide repeat protein n=1 Tax=Marinibactrum halimedae TaxID=1444977 RepID=A0AA37T883_9GAMM|nr:hypothetical protein [Marinibactrum halimedae]MCD9460822.1 hypothetical protein [Marinibactrum halimedae]GLS26713.1 hypothetical protein GCM10007877_24300 [Marinibactrum halimedae]